MKSTFFMIESDGLLREVSQDEMMTAWRTDGASCWVDMEEASAKQMIDWATPLGLNELLLGLLNSDDHAMKIVPLDDTVYFEYPALAQDADLGVGLFACLCLDRLVITAHEVPTFPRDLDGIPASLIRLPEPSTTALICGLAILQSTRLRRHVNVLRDQARSLSGTMDDDAEAVGLEEILSLKQSVLQLDGVVSDQLAALDLLQAVNKPVLELTKHAEIFQLSHNNTRATDRSIDRLESSTRDLQRRFDAVQQDKTNQRLGVLTILSAIFSPLTLLAGIYGMNFEYMPELHFRYAYPVALGGMVVIAGGLYWYFRSRGWLK